MTKHFRFVILALSIWPGAALAQTYAIRNVKIVTVSGATIPTGQIVIQDGKISAVGANIPIPASAKIIEGNGLTAYPGMIDAHTAIGLAEIDSVAGTQDANELGDLNPHMKASSAINPLSEHVAITRSNGITTVGSAPDGGLFAGQVAVINLDGWVLKDLLLKDSAGMMINFPREISPAASVSARQRRDLEGGRLKRIELLRKTLRDAQDYARRMDARADPDSNLALRALVPVVKGQMPAIFAVDTVIEIKGALEIADEFNLKAVLSGCAEAWRVVHLIKDRNVPVLFSSLLDLPRSDSDPYDVHFSTPSVLSKAGVRFALTTGGVAGVRDLPFQAGMAVGFGLNRDEALKAVTLYPAQILNIADKVGSIEEGKVANIIVTDGDPLELLSHVKHLFIAGRPVELKNKQTELYDTFSRRP